jgi:cytoskeletal protein RodZ
MHGHSEKNAKCFVEFGEKLRLARGALGLHIEEVARQLFVNKQRVIEIEKGDYSNIISQLHLRWYLSSYAKVVGIPEYEIPRITNEFANNDVSQGNKDEEYIINNSKKNSKFYRVFFLSLIAVLVLYLPNRDRDNEQIRHLINYFQQSFIASSDTNE